MLRGIATCSFKYESGDLVKKVLLIFAVLFLCRMNHVVWAGEYLDQGCEYMQIKHQYDEAEKYLTLAIEQGDNEGGIALLYRAWNYESGLKNYKAAIDDYTNFLENWGGVNSSIAIVGRGRSYYQIADYNSAITDYSTVIDSKKYDPNNMWYLYFWRAMAYSKIGMKDKALEDCNAAVSLIEYGKYYITKDNQFLMVYNFRSTLQTGVVDNQDRFTKARVGTNAPALSVTNLNGEDTTLSIDKPSVLLYLNHYQNEIDLNQYNDLYKRWKGQVNFYIIADSKNEDVNKIFDLTKLSIPILLDKKSEYTRIYNQVDPSLIIIDDQGIIRYNSSALVVVKELDSYLEKLVYNKSKERPHFSLSITENYNKAITPKLLSIGEEAGIETFKTVDNKDYTIKFEGKPTIMLIWLQISQRKDVQNKMDMMQAAAEMTQGKVRFLSVAGTNDNRAISYMTDGWNYNIPTLRLEGNRILRYTTGFPSFVVIDKNGKLISCNIKTQEDMLKVTKMLCDNLE